MEVTIKLKNLTFEQKCCLKEYIDKNTESSNKSGKQLPGNMCFSFYGKFNQILKNEKGEICYQS